MLNKLPGDGNLLALTVDDGVNTDVVRLYTEFANDTGIRLTYFVNGTYPSWTDNLALLRPLVECGQIQLGNHTWSHPNLTKLPVSRVAQQISRNGTVTLIEKCSGAVGFEAVATEHRWVVHISGGSVGRGDLTPDREAVGHLGSPFGRAEQMPSRPEVCGDAAEGGQEPLRMPRRFEAFHRPFALSGGLMRVLGAVVQIPRPPVLHRRHELAVGDLVAAQLVGDQHPRHLPQALAQLTEESLGRHRASA